MYKREKAREREGERKRKRKRERGRERNSCEGRSFVITNNNSIIALAKVGLGDFGDDE